VAPLTADDVVRLLELVPHPEGGAFAEVFRSALTVRSEAHAGARTASTAIYFLLKTGDFSALHRVRSDEVWHHYAGDPLELHVLDESEHRTFRLGKELGQGERPFAVVPANKWQAARVARAPVGTHGFALCGCTVAPGFEFADFELPPRAEVLKALPRHETWVRELTRP
jgi:predicted cupin superfamily sugar epimerase